MRQLSDFHAWDAIRESKIPNVDFDSDWASRSWFEEHQREIEGYRHQGDIYSLPSTFHSDHFLEDTGIQSYYSNFHGYFEYNLVKTEMFVWECSWGPTATSVSISFW